MSAATTMAPALNPTSLRRSPARRIQPESQPAQHMQALARANEVRLARAALKRQVGAGNRNVKEIVLECPWEAESMTISELLSSQRRWGKARSRKLIVSAGLSETKRIGAMTQRQRRVIAAALDAKEAC